MQRPEEKINHALILGGSPGIGKDALIEPLKYAIGSWNFREARPSQMTDKFNEHVRGVVLRINEAHDLGGDQSRFSFYETMKVCTAAPPFEPRVDIKFREPYKIVVSVVGIIYTTNYLLSGMYLPPDDRRHYVAWSEAVMSDFDKAYWDTLFGFYDAGGRENIAAFLAGYDLSQFDAKAAPPKTAAFWQLVEPTKRQLKEVVADLTLENRLLKKSMSGDGEDGA